MNAFPETPPRANGKILLALAAALFLLAVALQWRNGAYQAEFGGHPDEAAHYVTGLMIRDYLAGGFPGAPMAFAKDYYDHYPKVALGNWPPMFYLLQSAWTIPFSPSRVAVMLLMALLTTLAALVLFRALEEEFGLLPAVAGATAFVLLPLVQQHSAMVMTEIPIALFALLAGLSFGRYLDGGKTRDSVLFGVWASAAILTKGSGMMLALVPPLAVVFTRKFHLLTRANFWYSAAIVGVLCGPWTWKFRDVARAGWMEGNPSWHFTQQALVYYPAKLAVAVTGGLAALALVGLVVKLVLNRPASGKWAALGAMVIATLVFHSLVPAGLEPRHLLPVLPAVILFIFPGFIWCKIFLTERARLSPPAAAAAIGVVVIVLTAGFQHFHPRMDPVKEFRGFGAAAELLLERAEFKNAIPLISSDARGEGMFIAEVAMRERRPGHTVRRASKTLASATWGGGNYQAKVQDTAGLLQTLEKDSITLLVLDSSIPDNRRQPHHDLLQRAVKEAPEKFVLLGQFPITRSGVRHEGGIAVYQRR
ncbi:MAG: glycosyltransferase family 39 protein [Verrucomicrobia bacterium]|nr:glycosyltransferase family 39 protein [Verrucomicrobiota bacterium]